MSQHQYVETLLAKKDDRIRELEDSLVEQRAYADFALEAKGKGVGGGQSSGKMANKGGKKGSNTKNSGTGWMNRAVPLIAAVLDEQGAAALLLATDYEKLASVSAMIQHRRDTGDYAYHGSDA
jgi:hypothetical protein